MPLRFTRVADFWPALDVCRVDFTEMSRNPVTGHTEARSAFGRAVLFDQGSWEVRIYPFYDLINSNKGSILDAGCNPEPNINLGATVLEFAVGSRRETAPGGRYNLDARRCVYASNGPHTNFVRPNGFVVVGGTLVTKPAQCDAMGMDCEQFRPLQGEYQALAFDQENVRLLGISFTNGVPTTPLPEVAVSGPVLIRNGQNVSLNIPYRPRPGAQAPYGLNPSIPAHQAVLRLPTGPTQNDEVNYPPPATMASFSAAGLSSDGRIVLISMFEELRGRSDGTNLGITIYDLAVILGDRNIQARDAILLGGGADTQQFLRGGDPPFLVAPVRARSPGQGIRPEVEGPRGLGAILGVLPRQSLCESNGVQKGSAE